METATSACSTILQDEANVEESISLVFKILFCLNMVSALAYTYIRASDPWIMMASHVIALSFHFLPKMHKTSNNKRSISQLFAPWNSYITEAFPCSSSLSLRCSPVSGVEFMDTILFLFVLTPLRVYASGDDKGVLYLFFSLASVYPLLIRNWKFLAAGAAWGCFIHSPLFMKAVSYADIWFIFVFVTFYSLSCLWFSSQNKSLKNINEAKNTFLSNIGHEVRTPLHGIMGSIDALRSEVERIVLGHREANKTLEWLDVMHGCSVSLSEILDNMILLSKLDSNVTIAKGPPVKEEFAIRPFLKEIANLAFAYPKAPAVHFRYTVSSDVPTLCYTDRIGLRQVVCNLVTNGLKFTAAGSVVLRVSISKEQKNVLCFELADTGSGMSEDFMKRLFKPFSQENSGPRSHRGAGLGLFISATIAHRMDASISVISKKGLGTTMCLSFSLPDYIFELANQIVQRDGRADTPLPCALPSHISSQKLSQRRHTVPFVAVRRNSDVAVLVNNQENASPTPLSPTPSSPAPTSTPSPTLKLTDQLPAAAGEALDGSKLARQSLPTIYESEGAKSPFSKSEFMRRASGVNVQEDPFDDDYDEPSVRPVLPFALLCDDNCINLKVLTHCLTKIGFQISSFTSGEQAIESAKHTIYDICFLDVFMPGLSGIETARAIQQLPIGHRPKMIIGCSADTRGTLIDECKAAGMTDLITKPFKKDALRQIYDSLTKLIEAEEQHHCV